MFIWQFFGKDYKQTEQNRLVADIQQLMTCL